MTIDTRNLNATVKKNGTLIQSYTMKLKPHNFTDRNGMKWNYSVAHLRIEGNITLSSSIEIKGPHALSVISVNGSILVNTTLNVTCGLLFVNTTMCLGGFLPQKIEKVKDNPDIYNGKFFQKQNVLRLMLFCNKFPEQPQKLQLMFKINTSVSEITSSINYNIL